MKDSTGNNVNRSPVSLPFGISTYSTKFNAGAHKLHVTKTQATCFGAKTVWINSEKARAKYDKQLKFWLSRFLNEYSRHFWRRKPKNKTDVCSPGPRCSSFCSWGKSSINYESHMPIKTIFECILRLTDIFAYCFSRKQWGGKLWVSPFGTERGYSNVPRAVWSSSLPIALP